MGLLHLFRGYRREPCRTWSRVGNGSVGCWWRIEEEAVVTVTVTGRPHQTRLRRTVRRRQASGRSRYCRHAHMRICATVKRAGQAAGLKTGVVPLAGGRAAAAGVGVDSCCVQHHAHVPCSMPMLTAMPISIPRYMLEPMLVFGSFYQPYSCCGFDPVAPTDCSHVASSLS